jgi:hypothetical protein
MRCQIRSYCGTVKKRFYGTRSEPEAVAATSRHWPPQLVSLPFIIGLAGERDVLVKFHLAFPRCSIWTVERQTDRSNPPKIYELCTDLNE